MSNYRPTKIQIHFLASYPGTLLNRDENGQAKRITFGNTVRLRIASQCLKRHWRTYDGPDSIHSIPGVTQAIRSRETVVRLVIQPLRDSDLYEPEVMDALEEAFNKGVYGPNGTDRLHRPALLLGIPEINYLSDNARSLADQHPNDAAAATKAAEDFFNTNREPGKNVRAMTDSVKMPAGLVTGLFGRLVLSNSNYTTDGAVHVAHSMSVHQQEAEMDYFSVVDDLHTREEGAGAALTAETELTSGLYYGYVVIDLPGMISNIEACLPEEWQDADRTLAAQVVEKLITTIATVSPGAKLGSTAPYACAEFVLVEIGEHQPRTLMNAFRKPVASAQMDDSIETLVDYLQRVDDKYGRHEERAYMSVPRIDDLSVPGATSLRLPDLASWVSQAILSPKPEE